MRLMRWLFVGVLMVSLVAPAVAVAEEPQDEAAAKASEEAKELQEAFEKAGSEMNEPEEGAPAEEEEPDINNVLYALGLAVAENLVAFDLTEAEIAQVQAGLSDSLMGREKRVALKEMRPNIQALMVDRREAAVDKEKMSSAAFLAAMGGEEGAEVTESGLVVQHLVAGEGENPAPEDRVRVHYHGTLRDGTVFDSSVDRGEPAVFGLRQVIKCWTEGMQKIQVGGKARLACPSDIAYGDRGRPPLIAGGAALVFEVELLEIVQPVDVSE